MTIYSWIGGASGSYTDSADWSPFGVPGFGDNDSIVFGGANTAYTVTVDLNGYVFLDSISIADPFTTTVTMTLNTSILYLNYPTIFSSSLGINATVDFNEINCENAFVNQGTINAAGESGSRIWITDLGEPNAPFTNQGALNSSGDNSFDLLEHDAENDGTISAFGTSVFTANFNTFTNNGAITVQSTFDATAATEGWIEYGPTFGDLINDGVIDVDGGLFDLAQSTFGSDDIVVSGSGSIDISNLGEVRSHGGAFLNQNITFQGSGKLVVDTGVISDIIGFSTRDIIDYKGIPFAAGDQMALQSAADGVQTFALVDADGNALTTLNFEGQYSASLFAVRSDGSGDVKISLAGKSAPDDFDGDGMSDLLWSNAGGTVVLWNSDDSTTYAYASPGGVDDSWRLAGVGDFNGDGMADLLWRNTGGEVGDWESSASGAYTYTGIGQIDSTWSIAGVGDFNGDGKADILLQNTNGEVGAWESNGSGGYTYTGIGQIDSSWSIVGVGDFNGDGKADILLQNTNGEVGAWESNGSGAYTYTSIGEIDSTWSIAGVGDFNGDGKADVLLQNTSGELGVWESGASESYAYVGIGAVTDGWQVAGVGDFNGDGRSDILWRNANGDTYIWNSNNSGGFSGQDVGVVASMWTIRNS